MEKKEMPKDFMAFWYGTKSAQDKQNLADAMDTSEQQKEWAQFLASIKESVEKHFDSYNKKTE